MTCTAECPLMGGKTGHFLNMAKTQDGVLPASSVAACPRRWRAQRPKRILVIGITVLIAIFGLYGGSWRDFPMKTLLIGIVFAVGMVLATQAFASDATDCPHIVWKHGHYVCVIEDNS
jgi:hypothetical protein